MPELPEVEMTRRSFAQRIAGARVLSARTGKALRWPLGIPAQTLAGLTVGEIGRRGKYLLVPLHGGPLGGWLLMHLGMSGSLRFEDQLPPPGVHDHFEMQTTRGVLRLNDPRRFGAVLHVPSLQAPRARQLLDKLGPEPWTEQGQAFDAHALHRALQGKRLSIKQALLAGQAVVGVGNIYASEALFLACIHPATPARRIGPPRALRLRDAICQVLHKAMEAGGSTLRDYRNARGEPGQYQRQMWVYDREGQPCLVCQTPIRHIVQGQRSTWYCPVCQRP